MNKITGQFKSTDIQGYMELIKNRQIEDKETNDESNFVIFHDTQIRLSQPLSKNNNYYLNCLLQLQVGENNNSDTSVNINTNYIINVYLRRSQEEDGAIQFLKTYKVKNSNTLLIELVISPYFDSFDSIVFEIERNSTDYLANKDRRIIIKDNDLHLYLLENIVESLGLDFMTKIGVQGPSGLLMCINGEEIRIGKTGIYEMIFDINVTSLSFITNENVAFIVDYQY